MPGLITGNVLIGLGSNSVPEGKVRTFFIEEGIRLLKMHSVRVVAIGEFYETVPVGANRQANYINSVILVSTSLSPFSLLRRLKRIENLCGRRGFARPWSSRTLDMDIIDYKGFVYNWPSDTRYLPARQNGTLVLPHIHAHRRPFVLQPIRDMLPDWKHPVFEKSAAALLKEPEIKGFGGQIIRVC